MSKDHDKSDFSCIEQLRRERAQISQSLAHPNPPSTDNTSVSKKAYTYLKFSNYIQLLCFLRSHWLHSPILHKPNC